MGTDGTWPLFISTFLCRGNWFKSIFSILLPPDTIRQRGSEQNTTVHIFLFLSFRSFVYIIYLFFLHSLAFIFFSPLCCFSLSLRGIVPEWNCFSIQGVFVSLPNDCTLSSNEIWELEWLVYLHKSSSVLSLLITRVSGDHLWRDLTSLLTGTNLTMFFTPSRKERKVEHLLSLQEFVRDSVLQNLTKLCDSLRESGDFLDVWQRYSDAVTNWHF